MNHSKQQPYSVSGKSFTAVAISIASKAGQWVKTKVGEATNVQLKESVHDLVTEVDRGSELMIRKLIHTYFPDHAILGEEGAEPGSAGSIEALQAVKQSDYLWVIDPIDGTTNFVHGFPFYSISVALAYKGEVIVGVVYDPSRDELFVAEKGKGAYVHGKRMHVSTTSTLSQCLVATGLPTDTVRAMPANMRGIQGLVSHVRNIRMAGSAALHLAYVAAGRLDAFWEIDLNAWDLAAGALLVQESGGRVTDTQGRPYSLDVRHVLATNGNIHEVMVGTLHNQQATGFE